MTLTALAPAVPSAPAAPAPAALTLTAPAGEQLLQELDSATRASAEAHEATRALTDTVLACQTLPAEIYQYAPYLSQCLAAVTAASRHLTTMTGRATAAPVPDHLFAVRQATTALTAVTADLRGQTAALATAVAWFTGPPALASAVSAS